MTSSSPSITWPDRTHRSVGPEFTLPWNTTRTMAEVWAQEAADRRKRDRAIARQTAYRPSHLSRTGKIKFAGYDASEVQFRRNE